MEHFKKCIFRLFFSISLRFTIVISTLKLTRTENYHVGISLELDLGGSKRTVGLDILMVRQTLAALCRYWS
jgi:hypothetical protein